MAPDSQALGAARREHKRRRWPLGLRARVTVAFSLAGLLVSVSLALITYSLARSYLLGQRDSVARRQAFNNAQLVRSELRNPSASFPDVIASIRTENDGFALIRSGGRWYPTSARYATAQALPDSLRDAVLAGATGRQRFEAGGAPFLVVGVHIAEMNAAYFEAFPLSSLQRTLAVIGTTLAVGATITTLAAAGIGWYSSRRLLRPLTRVADAAADLAQGGLDTRLEEESDRDLHRLVSSFNEMADAVQSRIQREARFASDVSHELRTPLTALTAAVEVLDARRDDLPERSRQALDLVTSQVRRFDQMVLDLLEISRLDAGAADLHTEPVLIGDLVRRIAARNGFELVPVVVAATWTERPVSVDKRRFERVLVNLLDNARQHAGGAVRLAVEDAGGDVAVVVEDAGPGVPEAEKARIFERFARGAAARHRLGTGLGLALVAEHAHLQHGRAWVEDRPGGGSRFIVVLPGEAA